MKSLPVLFVTFFILLYAVSPVYSGTVFSSYGIGIPYDFPSTQSMGLGDVSIALLSPVNINRTNPAALHLIRTSRLSIQYLFENNVYDDGTDKANSVYSNFDGFYFVVPLGKDIRFASGLRPWTRADYHLLFESSFYNETYSKSVVGEGGLNTFNFSLSWSPLTRASIGITGNYVFGTIEEKWELVFNNTSFVSSNDVITTRMNGLNFTAGFIVQPWTTLSIGGIFRPGFEIDTETEMDYVFDTPEDLVEGILNYPMSWGLGAVYYMKDIGLVGMEYFTRKWNEFSIQNEEVDGLHESKRISIGAELLRSTDPFSRYSKRIAYRIGFSYKTFPVTDLNNNDITETCFSLGFGFPLSLNVAHINAAIQYGKRGNLNTSGLSENLLRISLAISGGEKWFVKRY